MEKISLSTGSLCRMVFLITIVFDEAKFHAISLSLSLSLLLYYAHRHTHAYYKLDLSCCNIIVTLPLQISE